MKPYLTIIAGSTDAGPNEIVVQPLPKLQKCDSALFNNVVLALKYILVYFYTAPIYTEES